MEFAAWRIFYLATLLTAASQFAAARSSKSKRRGKNEDGACVGELPFIGEGVIGLCADNFPVAPADADWVVHFYGTQCKHCKESANALLEAALTASGPLERSHLSTKSSNSAAPEVRFGSVDCHKPGNKNLCELYGVWKLPVIRALGPVANYTGAMESKALHEWARTATGVEQRSRQRSQSGGCGGGAVCPAYELYDEPKVAREFLRAHNVYRCVTGSVLLQWDARAFRTARKYAMEAPTHRPQHSLESKRKSPNGSPYGENVAIGETLQPGVVVSRWYNEIRSTYAGQGGAPRNGQIGLGHYTQIVWRKTLRVGCSFGQNRKVAICHYDPSGNERGKYMTQVAKPLPGYEGLEGEIRCGGPVDEISV